MAAAKKSAKKKPGLTKEDRLKIVDLLKAGGTKSGVARDFGVTRQYVQQIWGKYQEKGEDAFNNTGKRGRKKTRLLDKDERELIQKIVSSGGPEDNNILDCGSNRNWTMKALQTLMRRELDFTPTQASIRFMMHGWGVRIVRPDTSIDVYADEDDPTNYEDYRTDSEIARDIAIRDAKKNGQPIPQFPDLPKSPPPGDEMEIDEEAFIALRKKIMAQEAGEVTYEPPAPGQRVGKHKKAKANRTPPKKRRKKKKKR